MAAIIPALRYEDPRGAIDLLCEAFGFEKHAVHEHDGVIQHAELRLGDDYVMLGQASDEAAGFPAGPSTIYVVVDDPDEHCARAKAAGVEIHMELVDQDYGSREYAARDPEGNVWCFGTYRPSAG